MVHESNANLSCCSILFGSYVSLWISYDVSLTKAREYFIQASVSDYPLAQCFVDYINTLQLVTSLAVRMSNEDYGNYENCIKTLLDSATINVGEKEDIKDEEQEIQMEDLD